MNFQPTSYPSNESATSTKTWVSPVKGFSDTYSNAVSKNRWKWLGWV
jgi:hypothetical protein